MNNDIFYNANVYPSNCLCEYSIRIPVKTYLPIYWSSRNSGALLNDDKINQTLAQKHSYVVVVSSAAVLYPRLVSNVSMHGSCTERFTFNNKQRC